MGHSVPPVGCHVDPVRPVAPPRPGLRASAANLTFPFGWSSGSSLALGGWIKSRPQPRQPSCCSFVTWNRFGASHWLPSFWIQAVAFQSPPTGSTRAQTCLPVGSLKVRPSITEDEPGPTPGPRKPLGNLVSQEVCAWEDARAHRGLHKTRGSSRQCPA